MSPSLRSPRRAVVLLAVAGGGIALAARSATWASGVVDAALLGAGASGAARLEVDGASAAPGAGALALVVLAAAAALALAGPAAARLLGLLLSLSGVCLAVLAGSGWSDPQGAVAAEGERQVGVSAPTVSDVRGGPGPPIAVLAGTLVLVAGLGALRTASGWTRTSPRYEREPDDGPADPGQRSLWDALDRGVDPTRRAGAAPNVGPADPPGNDLPE